LFSKIELQKKITCVILHPRCRSVPSAASAHRHASADLGTRADFINLFITLLMLRVNKIEQGSLGKRERLSTVDLLGQFR
jgi:hypothetical protein